MKAWLRESHRTHRPGRRSGSGCSASWASRRATGRRDRGRALAGPSPHPTTTSKHRGLPAPASARKITCKFRTRRKERSGVTRSFPSCGAKRFPLSGIRLIIAAAQNGRNVTSVTRAPRKAASVTRADRSCQRQRGMPALSRANRMVGAGVAALRAGFSYGAMSGDIAPGDGGPTGCRTRTPPQT
jgi:hypothetical protein